MSSRRDIGKHRREEIISAASSIIAEQGIQNLSLSAIEEKAGMSRGQLTYYFPTKEDILLAVFDHTIDMLRQHRAGQSSPGCAMESEGWEKIKGLLTFLIVHPPVIPGFHALQYTFLSQISHRDDFRQRLASLYEHWRSLGAGDFGREMPAPAGKPTVSPRTVASFMQAILHGIAIQRVADPDSFDPQEMLTLTLHVLGSYLGKDVPAPEGEPPGGPDVSRNNGSITAPPPRHSARHEPRSPKESPSGSESNSNSPSRSPSRSTLKE